MPHVLSGCDARSLARPFPRGFVPTNVGHLIIIIIISPLMMDGRRDSGNGGGERVQWKWCSGNGIKCYGCCSVCVAMGDAPLETLRSFDVVDAIIHETTVDLTKFV